MAHAKLQADGRDSQDKQCPQLPVYAIYRIKFIASQSQEQICE